MISGIFSRFLSIWIVLALTMASTSAATRRAVNDGQLVLEDVPVIPQALVEDLRRYQNVRSATLHDWTEDGQGIYITTRFGDVNQLHRVDRAGGARTQLTFFDEPLAAVVKQPGSRAVGFSMDVGGSEFNQLFLLDPGTGEARLMTDGQSRNGAMTWSLDGHRMAYQSTRRNGRSNDVWIMSPDRSQDARLLLEAPDGAWWGPVAFSPNGTRVLIQQYVSITDSSLYLVDVASGESQRLVGDTQRPATYAGMAFDQAGTGIYYLTDAHGDFTQLAYRELGANAIEVVLTREIPWNVSNFVLSEDGKRGAFLVNNDSFSQLYLFDPESKRYRPVDSVPQGVTSRLRFSPDGSRLGMSVSTARIPGDVFVLNLGAAALDFGALARWTVSEVGGLDAQRFSQPELVRYPTFDKVDGQARTIPALVYRPSSPGPHPVVVTIHGGPEGQYRPRFSTTVQTWIDKLDVAVIAPNVRGSSGYGKTYVGLDNGFQREDSVRDIGALLDWIATQDNLDATRVAVIGGSYGGYMVLASAVHYSDRLRAAVDMVGISNFVTFLENTQDYRRDLRRAEYGDERDPAMRAHLHKISPLSHIDRIRVPLLVGQGQNDPRVPVTEAEQVVSALRANGRSVWYMNALNEGHGYGRKENRDVYQQAVVLFFRNYLLGP